MSIELPEAHILGEQLNSHLLGKKVVQAQILNCAKLQKLGFVNKEASDFDILVGGKVERVSSRGNVIRVALDHGVSLILAPEYGGKVLIHSTDDSMPSRFHLKLSFEDGAFFTVTLSGMGVIKALKNTELAQCYVYSRDFLNGVSPIEGTFDFKHFHKQLSSRNVNMKTALVGKDSFLVGLGNSAFQEILFLAEINPKRKASELSAIEAKKLFDSIKLVIEERLRLGGKDSFQDLFGKWGSHESVMGPHMKCKSCSNCGSRVEHLSLGGGQVYYCSKCQK